MLFWGGNDLNSEKKKEEFTIPRSIAVFPILLTLNHAVLKRTMVHMRCVCVAGCCFKYARFVAYRSYCCNAEETNLQHIRAFKIIQGKYFIPPPHPILAWDLSDHLQSPKPRNPEKSQKSLPRGVWDPPTPDPQKVPKKVRKVKKIVDFDYFSDFSDFFWNFSGVWGRGVPNSFRETF